MSVTATEVPELTLPVVASIVARTQEGMWPDRAAGEIGFTKAAFDTWLERGMNDAVEGTDSLERELAEQVFVADCQAEGEWFNGLRARSQSGRYINDFLAFMARRWPERWVERKSEPPRDVTFEDEARMMLAGADAARKADQPA